MDRIVLALLCIIVLAAIGCDTALPGVRLTEGRDGNKLVLITDSPGGNIDAFEQAFSDWSRIPGTKVQIRNWCGSACTFVFGYFDPEHICLSPGARVGFHEATVVYRTTSRGNDACYLPIAVPEEDSIATLMMFVMYPAWIQWRLSLQGAMGGGGQPAILSAEAFWDHGYRVCTQTD